VTKNRTYFLCVPLLALEEQAWYTEARQAQFIPFLTFLNCVSEMAGKHMATKPPASPTLPPSLIETCPRYEHAMQILGKRWTGLLINALMKGPRRFCELTLLVDGLSDRVLSDRLRELEVEGIVQRTVYPQIPVRVEYELTTKGHALKPTIDALHVWAEQWVTLTPQPKVAVAQLQEH